MGRGEDSIHGGWFKEVVKDGAEGLDSFAELNPQGLVDVHGADVAELVGGLDGVDAGGGESFEASFEVVEPGSGEQGGGIEGVAVDG